MMLKNWVRFFGALGVCGALLASASVQAQGFSALISPPRLELQVKPGEVSRQVLEITQVGPSAGRFRIYTADWQLSSTGGVDFSEALQPNSCRPWVALEARELTVAGNAKKRYRIEILPPADTSLRECRFAVMFEGLDESTVRQPGLAFPVSGRIGVIVYATLPGAQALLEISPKGLTEPTGTAGAATRMPVLEVRNSGDAHGRLGGLLTGVDAKGQRLELSPSTLPILPGETRRLSLSASLEGGAPVGQVNYPLSVKGALEWGGKRVPFEHTFTAP
jgi:hypothetical protein